MTSVPPLPGNLQRIVDAEYPRFSDGEMTRHRAAVEEAGEAMRKAWGEPEVRTVTMPLHVRCGRHA